MFVVSLFGKPRPVAELNGLVYGATKLPVEEPVPFYKNEWFWMVHRDRRAFWPSIFTSGKEAAHAFVGTFRSGFSSAFCSPFTAQ